MENATAEPGAEEDFSDATGLAELLNTTSSSWPWPLVRNATVGGDARSVSTNLTDLLDASSWPWDSPLNATVGEPDSAVPWSSVASVSPTMLDGYDNNSRGGGIPFAPTTAPAATAIWDSPLNPIIGVYVAVVLAFTMLGMGCTVEAPQMGRHLRRPAGVLIAALAQFAVMPLVAFAMANAFALGDAAAIAVLVCGCCPGGTLSNIMSLFIDGDMNLSIIMTASSALLALPLMPLCLWIYSRHWLDTPVVHMLPFGAIVLTLGGTLVPLGAGAVLRQRAPRAADIILKVSVWLLLPILTVLFVLTGSLLGPDLMAQLPASVYVVAVLMPLVGYGVGFGLARLCRLPPALCRTISMETGCQNVQLCTAILKLTFHPEVIGAIFLFPLLYALFQAAEAGLFILTYRLRRRWAPAGGGEADGGAGRGDDDDDDDEGGSVSYRKLKEEEIPSGPSETRYGAVAAMERPDLIIHTADVAVASTYV